MPLTFFHAVSLSQLRATMITTILVYGGRGRSVFDGHSTQLAVSVRSLLVAARMRYTISAETRRILEDLGHLRTAARALLGEASPEARHEWKRFEDRFPSDVEIRRGFIALSKPELEDMSSKVRRFRDILVLSIRSPFRVAVNGLEGPGEGVGDEGDQLV
jgi:hypothetical protein